MHRIVWGKPLGEENVGWFFPSQVSNPPFRLLRIEKCKGQINLRIQIAKHSKLLSTMKQRNNSFSYHARRLRHSDLEVNPMCVCWWGQVVIKWVDISLVSECSGARTGEGKRETLLSKMRRPEPSSWCKLWRSRRPQAFQCSWQKKGGVVRREKVIGSSGRRKEKFPDANSETARLQLCATFLTLVIPQPVFRVTS